MALPDRGHVAAARLRVLSDERLAQSIQPFAGFVIDTVAEGLVKVAEGVPNSGLVIVVGAPILGTTAGHWSQPSKAWAFVTSMFRLFEMKNRFDPSLQS